MQTTQSKDGTTLAYDVYGTGPTLIYISGATCFRSFMPIVQDAKTFAKEFTVYNYDRRGRGDSGDKKPYAIAREIDDIEAIIDAAGGAAYLYGHSSGAVLALEAAIALGKKINGIALYDASYVCNEKEKAEYQSLSNRVNELLQQQKNASAIRCFYKGIGMPTFFIWLMPLMPGWKKMKQLAPTLMYDIELTHDLPPVPRISAINLPVHIIVGEKSPASIHSVAKQLTQALPAASFTEISGQDHMVSAKILLPVLLKCLKGR